MKLRYSMFLVMVILLVISVEVVHAAKDLIYVEDYHFRGVVPEDRQVVRMTGIRFYFFNELTYETFMQNAGVIRNVDNFIQSVNLCLENRKIEVQDWGTKIQGSVASNDLHYLEVDLGLEVRTSFTDRFTQIEIITHDGRSYSGNVFVELKPMKELPPVGLDLQSESTYASVKKGDNSEFEFWMKKEFKPYHRLWQVRLRNVSKDSIIIDKMLLPYAADYMMVVYVENSPRAPLIISLEHASNIGIWLEPADVVNIAILKKKIGDFPQIAHGDFAPVLIYSNGRDAYRVDNFNNLMITSYGGRF